MSYDLVPPPLFAGMECPDPAPGMILIASPDMAAGVFTRSVVLITDHGADGSYGVVVNKRTTIPVVEGLGDGWAGLAAKPAVFYDGGPVSEEIVSGYGVTTLNAPIGDLPFCQRLANRLVLFSLREEPSTIQPYMESARFFLGLSSWEPGQLAEEIAEGQWFVAPALPADLIAPARVDVWAMAMRRQVMPLPIFASYPEDPSLN